MEEASLADYQSLEGSITKDVYRALDLDEIVNKRKVIGGPAASAVEADIKSAQDTLTGLMSPIQ